MRPFLNVTDALASNACALSRIDAELNCIKGGGGCQYREKVLAEAAKTYALFWRKSS